MRNNKSFLKQLSFGAITQKQITDTVPSYPESEEIETSNALFQKPFSILYHLNDKFVTERNTESQTNRKPRNRHQSYL